MIGRWFVAWLLVPFDLVRLTAMLVIITVRFFGQIYVNILSGMPYGRRPTLEFQAVKPTLSSLDWDDRTKFMVSRPLTLRMLGFYCGCRDITPHTLDSNDADLTGRVDLSTAKYFRMVLLLGLSWAILLGGPVAVGVAAVQTFRARDRAMEFRVSADGLFEKGEHARARIQYLNAIQQRSSLVAAHWGLARCAMKLNRSREAREALERVLALDVGHASARAALVDLLLAQGNPEQAIDQAIMAVKQASNDVEARLRLGECQRLLGRMAAARQEAETVLSREPDNGRALVLAALACAGSGYREEAENHLDHALAVVAEDQLDRYWVAKALLQCGKPNAAKIQLEKLLAQDPANVPALRELAELRLSSGDLAGAIAKYQTLDRIAPDHLAVGIRLAELLLLAQRLDEAFQKGEVLARQSPASAAGPLVLGSVYYLRELWGAGAEQCRLALRRDPTSMAGKILLCRILMRQEQWDEAVSWLKGLPEPTRDTLEIRLMMVECHLAREDRRAAQELLKKACADHPDSEAPHLLMARLHLSANEYAKAIASYKKALDLNPEHPLALNNLASLLSSREAGSQQNLDEAMKLASSAWSLRPGNPEIAETLGWLHVLRGEPGEGISLLNWAARQMPRDPVVRYHLAHALAGQNRYAAAAKQLELASELSPALAQGSEFQALRDILLARRSSSASTAGL